MPNRIWATGSLVSSSNSRAYERGLARLVHHEVDHLDGLLCTARVRDGVDPIPVEEHRQIGRARAYE
ncbi:hypothetical protein [Streptomyces formicae]|uniref:hypothetical protein n=1 Tax=Streptomyces formicae TaxID=1616117 RepID=UPI001F1BCF2D|nr:hypothetical protein [Streptomyces formicae]